MNLKHFLFSLLGVIIIVSSCKKNASEDLKDFSFYKENLSSNQDLIKMYKVLNQGVNIAELSSSTKFFNTKEFKVILANEFSNEKIKERVNNGIVLFKKFKQANPEFFKLTRDQKYELLEQAFQGFKKFDNTSFSIKVFSADCMGGFNHMANVCSKNHDLAILLAFCDVDPIIWGYNLAVAEGGYVGCLNDAADAMYVCGSGGY